MTGIKTTTVFLDAGGVILDESADDRARVKIAAEVLAEVVPDCSEAMMWSDFDESIETFCPRITAYAFWKHLKPDRILFDKLYDSFLDKWRECRPPLKLMPGFESEVRAIGECFKVGIAGQYGKELLDFLVEHSILDSFTYRLTQDDFSITKPDPRYLEQIAEACGVRAKECIMVGDRIDNDIIPAKYLGMKAILIRVGLHRNQQPRIPCEIPDAELDTIRGLAETVSEVALVT